MNGTSYSIHIFLYTSVLKKIWFIPLFYCTFWLMHFAPTTAYTGLCLFWFVWTMFVMWRVNTFWNLTYDIQIRVKWLAVISLHAKCQTWSIQHAHSNTMECTLCEDNHFVLFIVVLDNISLWDHCGAFTNSVLLGRKENHCWRLIYEKVCSQCILDTLDKYFLYETPWVIFLIKKCWKYSVHLLFSL